MVERESTCLGRERAGLREEGEREDDAAAAAKERVRGVREREREWREAAIVSVCSV